MTKRVSISLDDDLHDAVLDPKHPLDLAGAQRIMDVRRVQKRTETVKARLTGELDDVNGRLAALDTRETLLLSGKEPEHDPDFDVKDDDGK